MCDIDPGCVCVCVYVRVGGGMALNQSMCVRIVSHQLQLQNSGGTSFLFYIKCEQAPSNPIVELGWRMVFCCFTSRVHESPSPPIVEAG